MLDLFDARKISDGSPNFFVLDEENDKKTFKKSDEGGSTNNGMFSCHLEWKDYQASLYTERVYIACRKAQIVLVLEADATNKSPTGEMMKFASTNRNAVYLGHTGKNRGTGMLKLDETFTDDWRTGDVSDQQLRDTLNGGTYTINSIQVREVICVYLKSAGDLILSRVFPSVTPQPSFHVVVRASLQN